MVISVRIPSFLFFVVFGCYYSSEVGAIVSSNTRYSSPEGEKLQSNFLSAELEKIEKDTISPKSNSTITQRRGTNENHLPDYQIDKTDQLRQTILSGHIQTEKALTNPLWVGETVQTLQTDHNVGSGETSQSVLLRKIGMNAQTENSAQSIWSGQTDLMIQSDLSTYTNHAHLTDKTLHTGLTEQSFWTNQTDQANQTDLSVHIDHPDRLGQTDQTNQSIQTAQTKQTLWTGQTDQASPIDMSAFFDPSDKQAQNNHTVQSIQTAQSKQTLWTGQANQTDSTVYIDHPDMQDKATKIDQASHTGHSGRIDKTVKIDQIGQIWTDHTNHTAQTDISVQADRMDWPEQSIKTTQTSQMGWTDQNVWSDQTSQPGETDQEVETTQTDQTNQSGWTEQRVHTILPDQTNQIDRINQSGQIDHTFQYEESYDEEYELLEVYKKLFLKLQEIEKAIHNNLIIIGRNQSCDVATQKYELFNKSDLQVTYELTKILKKLWKNQEFTSNDTILFILTCLGNLSEDYTNAHAFNKLKGVPVLLSMLNCTQSLLRMEEELSFPSGNCTQPNLQSSAEVTIPAVNCNRFDVQSGTVTPSQMICAQPILRAGVVHLLDTLLLSSPRVQKTALIRGALSFLLEIILRDPDHAVRIHSLYALAHLIRNYPAAEAMFVKGGGLPILEYLFQEDQKCHELQIKVITMLHDLLMKHKMTIESYPGLDSRMDDIYRAVGMEKALIDNGWCTRILKILLTLVERKSHALKEKNISELPERTTHTVMEQEFNFPLVDICHENFNIKMLKQDKWLKLLI